MWRALTEPGQAAGEKIEPVASNSQGVTLCMTPRPTESTLEDVIAETQRDIQNVRQQLGWLRAGRRVADACVSIGMRRAVAAARNDEATSDDGTSISDHPSRGWGPLPPVDVGLLQTRSHLSQSDRSLDGCDDSLRTERGRAACGLKAAPEERLLQNSLSNPHLSSRDAWQGYSSRGSTSRTLNLVGDEPVGARLLRTSAPLGICRLVGDGPVGTSLQGTSASDEAELASSRHSLDAVLTAHPHHEPPDHVLAGDTCPDHEQSCGHGSTARACLPKAFVDSSERMSHEHTPMHTIPSRISFAASESDCESLDQTMGSCSIGGSSSSISNTRWWAHQRPPGSAVSTVDTVRFEPIHHGKERSHGLDHASEENELDSEELFLEDFLLFLQEQQIGKEARAEDQLRRVFLAACVKIPDSEPATSRSTASAFQTDTPRPLASTDSLFKHSLTAPVSMTQPASVPNLDVRSSAYPLVGALPEAGTPAACSASDRPIKPWVPKLKMGLLAPSSSGPSLSRPSEAGPALRRAASALLPCSNDSAWCVEASGVWGASPLRVVSPEVASDCT